MGVLLGYVVDIVVGAVMEMEIENAMKGRVIRALNKVVWIQNDLFAWAYLEDAAKGKVGAGETPLSPPAEGKDAGECPFSG